MKLSRLQCIFREIVFYREIFNFHKKPRLSRAFSQPVERILTTLVFEMRDWQNPPKNTIFVCLYNNDNNILPHGKQNRMTSLEWHRYHNWSYSLTWHVSEIFFMVCPRDTLLKQISELFKNLRQLCSFSNFFCWLLNVTVTRKSSKNFMDSGR